MTSRDATRKFKTQWKRRGKLEERLRQEITKRVKGHYGRNTELARYLGRTRGFVSEYMSGRGRADFDTSIALLQWIGLQASDQFQCDARQVGFDDLFRCEVDLTFLHAMRDPAIAELVDAISHMRERPALHELVELLDVLSHMRDRPEFSEIVAIVEAMADLRRRPELRSQIVQNARALAAAVGLPRPQARGQRKTLAPRAVASAML